MRRDGRICVVATFWDNVATSSEGGQTQIRRSDGGRSGNAGCLDFCSMDRELFSFSISIVQCKHERFLLDLVDFVGSIVTKAFGLYIQSKHNASKNVSHPACCRQAPSRPNV
jgi:hypothetical protein